MEHDDPRVEQAVKGAEDRARAASPNITAEMHIKALENGIRAAEHKMREANPAGPQ